MPQPIRTGFGPILDSIKVQLVGWPALDALGLTEQRVIPVAPRRQPPQHVSGDADILLRVGALSPDRRNVGGGRSDRRARRRLSVVVRTRLALDTVDSDYLYLTDATLGHLAWEEAALDALDTFQPTDAAGNVLCYEPLIWVAGTFPPKDPVETEWGESTLELDVPYLPALTQSLQ